MFYKVQGIETLEELFPNLKVIRGRKLFVHHSLVVVEMPHLKTVGLVNLNGIQRGFVFIKDCPKLCHLSTVSINFLVFHVLLK